MKLESEQAKAQQLAGAERFPRDPPLSQSSPIHLGHRSPLAVHKLRRPTSPNKRSQPASQYQPFTPL